MSYDVYPGYESVELPPREQRIQDAQDLLALGALARIRSTDRASLFSEIKNSRQTSRTDGYIIGPSVFFNAKGPEPFAPEGLALWQLPANPA